MQVRIVSDLHNDISDTPVSLPQDNVPVLVCGDVSNNIDDGIEWIRENVRQGFVVAGNHDSLYGGLPIEDVHARLREAFPKDGPVVFLENDHVVQGDTVIVGATLWSEAEAQQVSPGLFRMNDYNLGFVRNPDGSTRPFTPEEAHKRNKATLDYLSAICKKYPDKNIVVMTHHPPTERSLPANERGQGSEYANNLEAFIAAHPNIKVWAHGHVHEASNYQIGNCRVVSNPRGYNNHQQRSTGLSAVAMDRNLAFGSDEYEAITRVLRGQDAAIDPAILSAAQNAIRDEGRMNPDFDPNRTIDLPVKNLERNKEKRKTPHSHPSTLKETLRKARHPEKTGIFHSVTAFFSQSGSR